MLLSVYSYPEVNSNKLFFNCEKYQPEQDQVMPI